MTYQPVIPVAGYGGWLFLNRTRETQQETFAASPKIQRDVDYFRENIGKVKTAEALVDDRRLLTVALGAYGLDEDIDAKAFIREILSEGTLKDDALANRLADTRYRAFSRDFGFGDLGARTNVNVFVDRVIERYETRQFERAVGEIDNSMRLALNLERGLGEAVSEQKSNDARWFAIMGNPPLRQVFETALGFPRSFGAIDLDKQLAQFTSRAESTFGTADVEELMDEEMREKIVRLFLVREQISQISTISSGNVALSLLSNLRFGG